MDDAGRVLLHDIASAAGAQRAVLLTIHRQERRLKVGTSWARP